MRGWLILTVMTAGVPLAPAAGAEPGLVAATEWASYDGSDTLFSLRVYPTAMGRAAAGQPGADAQGRQAWQEVLASAPDADTPGMREQFLCHWRFAELVRPGKTSWNLEPWRPVVDAETMVDAACNPGAAEESF